MYNPVDGNWGHRYPLSIAVSHHDGRHWARLLDLETEPGEFSYPAAIAQGGLLHVTYTWNRRTIAYRCVSLADRGDASPPVG